VQREIIRYDIVIVGAGPAGCAAALALKNAGLKIALLDKASFPRDKVCGDAIPGRAIKTLNSIHPAFAASFKQFPHKCETKKATAWYKGRNITFNWTLDAYTCARLEFDNFLFSLVKENTNAEIFTDTCPEEYAANNGKISITIRNSNKIFETKILIGADGAQSVAAKQLAARTVDKDHHVGSVRAYFSNVSEIAHDTVEVYFEKKLLPSYLWVFPLPGNMANVGFGMLSAEVAKRKINLKKTFYEFIDRSPQLRQKFSNVVQVSELEGFGLPLGSRSVAISGSNFMLTGDAASLIDPITGDGIGNAMLSGKLAAEQAIRCFQQNDFTTALIKDYDTALRQAIGKELKDHYKAQRILSGMPFLLDMIFAANKSRIVNRLISKNL
jgi:menaquinone-9 beta-reductase